MNRKNPSLLPLGVVLAALVSCGPVAGHSQPDARPSHDNGTYTQGRNPTWWHKTDPAEFVAGSRELAKYFSDPLADTRRYWTPAETNETREYLQAWANHIDATLRATPWGRANMAGVPVPTIILREDDSVNAYVSSGLVRYAADVSAATADPDAQAVAGAAIEWRAGRVDTNVLNRRQNIVLQGNSAFLPAVVDRMAAFAKAAGIPCAPEIASKGKVTFGDACKLNVKGDSFVSTQTLDTVTVHTGLVKHLDEAKAIAAISHELGHYYRGHGTDTNRLAQFQGGRFPRAAGFDLSSGLLYSEKEFDVRKAPVGLTDETSVAKAVGFVSAQLTPLPEPTAGEPFDRAVIQSLLFTEVKGYQFDDDAPLAKIRRPKWQSEGNDPLFASYLAAKCSRHLEAKADCETLFAYLDDKPLLDAIARMPALPPEKTRDYVALSNLLGKVFTAFEAKRGIESFEDARLTTSVVPFSEFLTLYGRNAFSVEFTRTLFDLIFSGKLDGVFPARRFFDLAVSTADAKRSEYDALLRWGAQERIGWYTLEQEADDFSLEVLSLIGLNPMEAPRLQLALDALSPDSEDDPSALSPERCGELLANGFRDAAGVFEPLALRGEKDWFDVHHSSCYRAFSMLREIKLHRWTSRTDPVFPFARVSWASLQARMPLAQRP